MPERTTISNAADFARVSAEVFNTRDVDAFLALYEPDATLVLEQGQQAKGTAAVRAALVPFFAMTELLTVEPRHCIQAGDLAIVRSTWKIRGTGPDGKPAEAGGDSAELIRRQPDGRWLFVIDAPFGAV